MIDGDSHQEALDEAKGIDKIQCEARCFSHPIRWHDEGERLRGNDG